MDLEGVLLAFKVLRARNMNFWLLGPLGEEAGGKGRFPLPASSRASSLPQVYLSQVYLQIYLCCGGEVGLPYWQASQSGSSIAHAFGTGAGPAGAASVGRGAVIAES
ncbi:hypothetical protein A234_12813, partial [Pseudomonas syringae pv. actinidiae ICMP 19101]